MAARQPSGDGGGDGIARCPIFAHHQAIAPAVKLAAQSGDCDGDGVKTEETDAPASKRPRLDAPPQPPAQLPDAQPPAPPSPQQHSDPEDADHAERMEMHEKLRDFDVLDEVQGDDDDDDDEDDEDDGRNGADRPAGEASALYDESSDTDLETDSGLTLARRYDSRRRRRGATVATDSVETRIEEGLVKLEPASMDGGDTTSSEAAAASVPAGSTAAAVGVVAPTTTGGNDDDDVDFDDDELEALLNEGLPEDMRIKKKHESQYDEKFKTVLVELEQNHFEVLPEGWVQVTHNSGVPLYLHTASRVCSASRPYFLGPGSVRKHEIPISAVPCFAYRRSLDKEQLRLRQLEAVRAAHPNANANDPNIALLPIATQAVIETVNENRRNESLTPDQLTAYCSTLFRFKQVRVMRFKSWQARRKFTKSKKHIKNLQRPTLPEGTKLISFPIHHAPLLPPLSVVDPPTAGASTAAAAATAANGGDATAAADETTGAPTAALAVLATGHPRQRREWIMNPNGKSYVCILHEYVQHALKKQPTYEFKELENAATPYSATVSINELKYGTGFGTSKKQAKSEAARETLEVLIPEMRDKITGTTATAAAAAAAAASTPTNANGTAGDASTEAKADASNGSTATTTASGPATAGASTTTTTTVPYNRDASVFDEIRIEDPRVTEFCSKTTEPLPHAILLTCLQRNYGLGEVKISYQVNTTKHKRNEFTMTVGKHSVTVACKNKRDGKHRAAQAILQILHPHVRTWGSLLRLYGNRSVKSFKEKKQEEQEITVLQSRAAINQPNYAILDKLRLEMTKLMERRSAVRPIGTFRPPVEIDLPVASGSGLNNVKL